MPKRISIVTVCDNSRVGDVAIAIAAIRLLRKCLPPNSMITCHTWSGISSLQKAKAVSFKEYIDEGVQIAPALFPNPLTKEDTNVHSKYIFSYLILFFYTVRAITLTLATKLIGSKARYLLHNAEERKALYDLINTDLIIKIGGYYEVDYTSGLKGFAKIVFNSYPLIIGSARKRRTVILGVSSGPVGSAMGRFFLKRLLLNSNRDYSIYSRDEYSKIFLTDLGIPSARTEVISDLAFTLIEDSSPETNLNSCNLRMSKLSVAVIPCNIAEYGNKLLRKEKQHQFEILIAKVSDYLIESKEAVVCFVPHCVDPIDDDRLVIKRCRQMMYFGNKSNVIPYMSSPINLRNFYLQGIDLVISARLHAIILSHPIPAIGIVRGGQKMTGTFQMLDMSEFVFDPEKEDIGVMKKKIDMILANYSMIKRKKEIGTMSKCEKIREAVFSVINKS